MLEMGLVEAEYIILSFIWHYLHPSQHEMLDRCILSYATSDIITLSKALDSGF